MTPKVLFVGGEKGSWTVRGKQIATALGARYGSKANQLDWDWPDVIVLVKRAAEVWWKEAAASGKPIIWDVLDFWRQPRDNGLRPADLLPTIRQIAKEAHASTLIGATEAMAKDIGGVYIPHHSRIGLVPTTPRVEARVVAYDGSARYLGSWRRAIEHACSRTGMTFVINPVDLSQADILVAFRGEEWDGPICREWKSGVKYVNAIAAGRPILTQKTTGGDEIQACALEVEDSEMLVDVLASVQAVGFRQFPYEYGRVAAPWFSLEAVAVRYREILSDTIRRAA